MKRPESSDEMDKSGADGASSSKSTSSSKSKSKRRSVAKQESESSSSSSSDDGSGSDGYETWEEDEDADNSELDEYLAKVRKSGLHVVHLACLAACGLLGCRAYIHPTHIYTYLPHPTQERKRKKAQEQRKGRERGHYGRLEDGSWGYIEPERRSRFGWSLWLYRVDAHALRLTSIAYPHMYSGHARQALAHEQLHGLRAQPPPDRHLPGRA